MARQSFSVNLKIILFAMDTCSLAIVVELVSFLVAFLVFVDGCCHLVKNQDSSCFVCRLFKLIELRFTALFSLCRRLFFCNTIRSALSRATLGIIRLVAGFLAILAHRGVTPIFRRRVIVVALLHAFDPVAKFASIRNKDAFIQLLLLFLSSCVGRMLPASIRNLHIG